MTEKQKIGKAVRALRQQKGITTIELKRRGIHPHLVSSVELAKKGAGENYGIETLFLKYLPACEITPEELFSHLLGRFKFSGKHRQVNSRRIKERAKIRRYFHRKTGKRMGVDFKDYLLFLEDILIDNPKQ